MYSKYTFRYVPKIAEVRGQGVGKLSAKITIPMKREKQGSGEEVTLALHQRPIKYIK